MKIFISAAICSLVIISACKDTKKEKTVKYSETEKGTGEYSISAPAGWTKNDTVIMGKKMTILRSPLDSADTFLENMNVLTEETGKSSLEEYVDANLQSLEKQFTDFKLDKSTNRSINNKEFKFLKYSHVYQGIPVDVETYITLNNGLAYVITCSAQGGTISEWEPAFEEAIRTFKID
jgi:hypothetical protein